jgi:NADPH oxidase
MVLYAVLIAVCKGTQTSGELASAIGGLAVIFGLRNNVLTTIFSISFERALFYHKLVAVLSLILSAIHGAFALVGSDSEEEGGDGGEGGDDDRNSSGFVLIALMAAASLSYLVKKYFFEGFYYFHFLVYFAIVVLSAIHGATLLAVAIIFWVADLLLRYALTVHKVEATIEMLPADVVRIRFPKRFAYSPGQYCFVSVPALSYLQFHVSADYVQP